MKKLLKVLTVLALLVTLVSLAACNHIPTTRFMSKTQVNNLAKQFEGAQAEMTLNYQTGNSVDVEVKIVYNMLFTKAPLATIRFIQLVNDKFYDDTVMDTHNTTNNYMVFGRYLYKESAVQTDSPKVFFQNLAEKTIKGEFKSNNYPEPEGGYAPFKIFSLGMYHDESVADDNKFDTGVGYVIFAMANETLNPANYAVFADMASISYKYGSEGELHTMNKVPAEIFETLHAITSKTSPTEKQGVFTDATETTRVDPTPSILSKTNPITIHIRMLGDYDWSKLPQLGR